MSEIADDIINGFFCEKCCVLIDGEEPGYPRKCNQCKPKPKKKFKNKKVNKNGFIRN